YRIQHYMESGFMVVRYTLSADANHLERPDMEESAFCGLRADDRPDPRYKPQRYHHDRRALSWPQPYRGCASCTDDGDSHYNRSRAGGFCKIAESSADKRGFIRIYHCHDCVFCYSARG